MYFKALVAKEKQIPNKKKFNPKKTFMPIVPLHFFKAC